MNVTPAEPTSSRALLGFIASAALAAFGLTALVTADWMVAFLDLGVTGLFAGAKLAK